MAWKDEEQPAPARNAPAGWYPDGRSAGWDRWWDGTEWIDRYRVVDTSQRPPTRSEPTSSMSDRSTDAPMYDTTSYDTSSYDSSSYDTTSYDAGDTDTGVDDLTQGRSENEWAYRGPDGETVHIPDWVGRGSTGTSRGCLQFLTLLTLVGVVGAIAVGAISAIRNATDNDEPSTVPTPTLSSAVTASTLVPNIAPTGDVAPTDSPFMYVVGDLGIPAGPEGELSVVAIGDNGGNNIPVIVRNMTETTYSSAAVSAQGSNDFGENVGPMPLGPGEWGIGYVGFDSIPTALNFEVVGETSIPSSDVFFPIDEAAFDPSTDRIIGTVTNTFDADLDGGSVLAQVVCVSEGVPIAINVGVPSVDTLPVMAPSPFAINTFGIDCSSFAVIMFTTNEAGVEGAPVQAS